MTESSENKDGKTIAFFDFDGTLTTGDTLMPFLKYVVGAPKYYATLALVSPVLMAYFAKLIRNDVAKEVVLKKYLAGYGIDELFELGMRFSEEIIPTMLRPEGMKRLRWHQQKKHECVLVSASLNIYLDTWAAEQNFSDVICSQLKTDARGKVLGRLHGTNCHGREKVRRTKKWLTSRDNKLTIFAYGDTKGDLPLLVSARYGYLWNRKSNRFNVLRGGKWKEANFE